MTSHKKTALIMAAACASTVALVSACAPDRSGDGGDGAGEVITYRVATIEGVGTPMNDGFDRFVAEVEECSDGRLVGENFGAGQLGGFVDLIDGNRTGTYEITSGGFDVEGELSPTLSALSLGYIFQDEEHVEAVIENMLPEMAAELEETTGATILAMGEDGWRWTFTSRPIDTLDDLAGLKLRVPEAEIPLGLWTALGASPTPVPFTEMYSALETGVIEGGESSVAQIYSNAFWEPAPYVTNTHHWFNIKPVRANAEWFNGLDADLQDCLTTTAQSVFADVRQESRDEEAATLAEMAEQGVTVLDQPADLEAWAAASQVYTDSYLADHPEAATFIEDVMSYAGQ